MPGLALAFGAVVQLPQYRMGRIRSIGLCQHLCRLQYSTAQRAPTAGRTNNHRHRLAQCLALQTRDGRNDITPWLFSALPPIVTAPRGYSSILTRSPNRTAPGCKRTEHGDRRRSHRATYSSHSEVHSS